MATTANPLLEKVSGRISNIVVKQYEGKTVVSAVPDMSGRKLSQKQKEANTQMQFAIIAAKSLTSQPFHKQRACEILQVAPNKVFRAIVREFLLTDGTGPLFGESQQESQDKQTLTTLKTKIKADIPDAEIHLFGDRATGAYNDQSDWDILILTTHDYSNAIKWPLQEKLFAITIQQGTRVNILLAQKAKWHTEPEYEAIRTRIEGELLPVK